jgi:GntR family transcriptional repressor for pyruvate dehydrogenase complex
VDYIKDLIIDKKFKAGDKIPTERELAHILGVSSNTIREAYKVLATQGYLTIKHGNGVFISDAETQIHNITSSFFVKNDHFLELFTVRKVLETHAVKWTVDHYRPQYGTELMNIVEEAHLALKDQDNHEKLANLDQKFHLSIIRMSDNSILLRIMMNLIDLLSEVRTESIRIEGRAEQSWKEHLLIVETIMVGDSDLAQKYLLEHLNSVEKSVAQSNTNGNINHEFL